MKTIAVIPCFEEEQFIGDVVFSLNEFVGLTIVADDNSADDTAIKAESAGAYVIRRFGKRGFGVTLQAGINEALLKDCDIVITLDGDGQHDPRDTFKLIKLIEDGEADVVIGSRFLENGNTIPRYRRFGIQVINWLYNVFSKQKITDAQCCFRAYRQEVLRAMSMNEQGFTFSTETLIKARALGFRITEVPVKVLYHKQYSQNSTLNPIRHGLSVAWGTVKLRIRVEFLPKIRNILG